MSAVLTKYVMEQIVAKGAVVCGWIGVEAQNLTPKLASGLNLRQTRGVSFVGVLRGGPAAQAGIRPGDVLSSIDGKEPRDATQMIEMKSAMAPGKRALLPIMCNSSRLTLMVTIGRRPPPEQQ